MFMRTRALATALIAMLAIVGGPTAPAIAGVDVRVSVKSQTMDVFVEGQHAYTWKVSTAKRGYSTPRGAYSVKRTEKRWYSRKYNNAPMPHSLFFTGGYAIHGTTEVGNLGRRASRGCIRLHPQHAAELYRLVQNYGRSQTRISIRN